VRWEGELADGDGVAITVQGKIRAGARGQTVSNQATLHVVDVSAGISSAPPGGPEAEPTTFDVAGVVVVPALSPEGLAALVLLLAAAALGLLRRLS
jgi:hypothetical protein